MGLHHVHIQCSCHSPDHLARVTLETTAHEHPELSIQLLLNPNQSFFRRLWIALRYIFGIRHQGSQFEDILLDDNSVDSLTTLVAKRNLIVKLRKTLAAKRARERLVGKPERPQDSP